jgi:hypothetical protein
MFSGWGLGFLDYDNDGWLDLILTNGHPDDTVDQRNRGVTFREPICLLHNREGRKFDNVSARAGPAFAKQYAARGMAIGDLNNDGFPDVVFTENGGSPHVLMNNAASGNHWLGLQLAPKRTNPAAVGAVIRWSINGKILSRQKAAGGSFLSSRDPREIIGTGNALIDWIEIRWPPPSRTIDRILKPQMDRYLVITEGRNPAART